MITVTWSKIKYLTQESYDNFLENLEFHQLECTCGKFGNLIKHGSYCRTVKTPDGVVFVKILRVICQLCKKTHAILPSSIVPYSQTQLCDHIEIIKAYDSRTSFEPIMENNQSIDESNIRYIIRKYLQHWKERLASINLSLVDDIIKIATQCLTLFGKQFMQIKSMPNRLFVKPT